MPLRIVIAFVLLTSWWGSPSAVAEDLRTLLMGRTWKCTAAESEDRPDPVEEGDTVRFTEGKVLWHFANGERWEFTYQLNERDIPASIDWCYDKKDTPLEMKGIIKCDGRTLQICGQLGFKGDPIVRPKEFATKKGDDFLRMIMFTAISDGGDTTEND